MDLSLPGLLGAMLGSVIGAINYAVIMRIVEPRLRALDKSQTRAERDEFEGKIALMRRIILTIEVVVLAAIGYWLGRTFGG
jgi:ABC-type spermidine/putrescine transport system permease subunit II